MVDALSFPIIVGIFVASPMNVTKGNDWGIRIFSLKEINHQNNLDNYHNNILINFIIGWKKH
jgi:hypothetical protein